MSEQPPAPRDSALSNPQVIAAIVGGIVTVIVAIVGVVPAIINSQKATPVVITATPVMATTAAVVLLPLPTSTPPAPTALPVVPTEAQVQLTPIVFAAPTEVLAATTAPELPSPVFPSATVPPENPPTQAAEPNVLLLYDDVSFTLLNQAARTLSLEGVVFRSPGGEWEARRWGPSIYTQLPANMCLRLRDASVGQRQPPAPCVNKIFALQEVGDPAIFWLTSDRFDVVRQGQVIASCAAADQQCALFIP